MGEAINNRFAHFIPGEGLSTWTNGILCAMPDPPKSG